MHRYVLVIQYKGTDFSGSQKQSPESNLRTVQGELEKAICTLTKQNTKTVFSGRTDAGVHAREQYVHFDVDIEFGIESTISSLNGLLPDDISVSGMFKADKSFHVQRSAVLRFYRYKIINRAQRSAFDEDCLYIRDNLNVELMNSAIEILKGEHDFSAFKKSGTDNPAKICNLVKAKCYRRGDEVLIDAVADRFLYGMIRAVVGTLLMIEKKSLPAETIKVILDSKDRRQAGPAVSPSGLTLMKVIYEQNTDTEKAYENILG